MIFNLLPIPPLDGWHALLGLVDARTAYNLSQFEQYGFVVLILIIFVAPHVHRPASGHDHDVPRSGSDRWAGGRPRSDGSRAISPAACRAADAN